MALQNDSYIEILILSSMDSTKYSHALDATETRHSNQTPMPHSQDPIPQLEGPENQRYHVRTFQINCQAELVYILDCYKWRDNQISSVVRPKVMGPPAQKLGLLQLRIMVQKNWTLLSEMGKVCFTPGLSILIGALKGFQILYNKFGSFGIRDSMICVSQQKEVRVWMNTDFLKSDPEFQPRDQDPSPKQMVRQVFRQVQPHIQNHLLLTKLNSIISRSQSFKDAVDSLGRFLAQCTLPGNRLREQSLSERKYFCRNLRSQDRVKTFHGMTESNLPTRLVTIKNLLQKPACLVFRQQHKQNAPQDLVRKEIRPERSTNTPSTRQGRVSRHVLPEVTVTLCPKSESRLHFGSSKNVEIRLGSQGQNSPAVSPFCSGYEFSLQARGGLSRKSGFGPQLTLGSCSFKSGSSRKRTGSVSYNSPPPFSYQRLKSSDQLGFSALLSTAAKSTATIKKDNLALFNSNNERSNDRSDSPNYQSSQTLSSNLPRSKRTSIALELLKVKRLNQSIIEGQMIEKQKPDLIGQLKHSLFNRKDDLKHSEIIMQTNSELSIQEAQQEGQQPTTTHDASILNTMSLKPMVQSIIMDTTCPNQELSIEDTSQCQDSSADLTSVQQPLSQCQNLYQTADSKTIPQQQEASGQFDFVTTEVLS